MTSKYSTKMAFCQGLLAKIMHFIAIFLFSVILFVEYLFKKLYL